MKLLRILVGQVTQVRLFVEEGNGSRSQPHLGLRFFLSSLELAGHVGR